MKKIHLSLVICILVSFFAVSFVSAKDNVVEVPDLKIIIDGKVTAQEDAAISVSQRTLLPLRELAAKLGVQNDSEHIIWDNKEKSVTLIKDAMKIYLKQGDKTAYVNGTPVELDVAPVGHTNSKTYIPFRFVAEALGKEVIWDGSTKSILICDKDEFGKVKEIMQKSNAAMELVEKCSADIEGKVDVIQDSLKIPVEVNVKEDIDKPAKKMHMVMDTKAMGMQMMFEYYFDDTTAYMHSPMMEQWVKQDLAEAGFGDVFAEGSSTNMLDGNDILSAGLSIIKDDGEGDIVLEGDVYLDSLLNMAGQSAGAELANFDISSCHLKISIDRNTYKINSMDMQVKGQINTAAGSGKMDMNIIVKYNYNTDFKIEIPEEVIKNAVEGTEGLF